MAMSSSASPTLSALFSALRAWKEDWDRYKEDWAKYEETLKAWRACIEGIMGAKVKCLKCGDIIQSTHRHDFRWCSCQSVAVDGGDDYMRIVGDSVNWEILNDETDAGQSGGPYTTDVPGSGQP